MIGNKKYSAHHNWFEKHQWLEYSISKDAVFCFYCKKAFEQKCLFTKQAKKSAFVSENGFSDWKNATGRFPSHAETELHKEAVLTLDESDIRGVFSSEWKKNEAENRRCLMLIIENIKFLARQGLALRGHDDKNSNFHQINLKDAKGDEGFTKWLEKKSSKYTSHSIQNELIQVMAHEILRVVIEKIKTAQFFGIMADETADKSNTEQLVFCARWIDQNFGVHEDFLGLHALDTTKSDYLVSVLKKICLSFDLDFKNIRAQCFDGASNMTGIKSGVKTQILEENDKALFVHCYNHALNLAVGDTLKTIQLFKDTLSMCNELINLVKKSPKRTTRLKNIKLVCTSH